MAYDDDFEPNEDEVKNNQENSNNNINDKINGVRNNIDDAKKFRNTLRSSKGASKGAESVGKQAGKQAGKKAAAKQAGKQAAQKMAAKQAAKGAVAAAGGAATGGLANLAMAAKDVSDKARDVIDKKIKEQTGVDTKKLRKFQPLIMIFMPFIIFGLVLGFAFMIGSMLFVSNEQLSTDFDTIIQKRESRYNKKILEFTANEINELIYKSYDMDQSDESKKDPCYADWSNDKYDNQYSSFFNKNPTDNSDTGNAQFEKTKSYVQAGIFNFNKVNWQIVNSSGGTSSPNMVTAPNTQLKIPDTSKYGNDVKTYEDMLSPYIQLWIVPYALSVASESTDFGDKVLNEMDCPVDVKLYQINRLTKVTTIVHDVGTSYEINPDTGVEESHSYDTTTTNSTEQEVPYKYIPKITSAESFYTILHDNYKIIKLDTGTPPNQKSQTKKNDEYDSGNRKGTKTITTIIETWDDTLIEDGTSKTDSYKVSYYNDDDYQKLDRKISRVEWYQDYGIGENAMYPSKTDEQKQKTKEEFSGDNYYDYNTLSFGYYEIEKYYDNLVTTGQNSDIDFSMIPSDGFAWPVKLNDGYTVTSPFGLRDNPTNPGNNNFHTGIDISKANAYGTPVFAAQSGTVIEANDGSTVGRGYGNHVIIKHENDYYTLYGHLSQIEVQVGQTVQMGQEIGKIGSTGNSTGPHLHFEIRKGTGNYYLMTPLDPMKFFNKDGTPKGATYGTTGPFKYYDKIASKYPDMTQDMQQYVYNKCKQSGIDYELVLALIYRESSFRKDAIATDYNKDGSIKQKTYGFMQVATDASTGSRYMSDPKTNIDAGMSMLAAKFKYWSDPSRKSSKIVYDVLNSYNFGDTGWRNYVNEHGSDAYSWHYAVEILKFRSTILANGVI